MGAACLGLEGCRDAWSLMRKADSALSPPPGWRAIFGSVCPLHLLLSLEEGRYNQPVDWQPKSLCFYDSLSSTERCA